MPSVTEFDKRLLPRLPLPLAQLYKRSAQAPTPFAGHQAAYYLWEAGIKLLGVAALTEYANLGLQSAPVANAVQQFSKFGIGHWWGLLRTLLPELASSDEGFRAARDLILSPSARMPETGKLLAELTDGTATEEVRLGLLFDHLVAYRNIAVGHGAAGMKPPSYYEAVGKRLRASMTELFDRLDPLAGRQLLFVTNLYRSRRAEWQVDFRPLTGDDAQPTRTLPLPDSFPADRLPTPEHLYLGPRETMTPGDVEAWLSITPLAVFQADQVFLYNGRHGRERVQYLCYTTGDTTEERYDEPARRAWPRFLNEAVFGQRSDRGGEPESDVAPAKPAGDAAPGSSLDGKSGSGEPAKKRRTNIPRWIGDCDIRSVIGQGATGIVYRAKQRSLEREVALKQLLLPERDYARFEREIRALARVDHPSVVKVHTSGEDRGLYYFTMDLVEGTDLSEVYRTLSDKPASDVSSADWRSAVAHACETARGGETWVDERPPIPARNVEPAPAAEASEPAELRNADYVRHVAELVRQVAEGAHALHLQSIIHRDIKPGNIRVTPDGRRAVLVDLGLAKLADQTEGSLTRSRQIVGTLRYASPEQVLCDPNIDRGADVYSLGATLWELLTLRPMFDAGPNTREADLIGRIVRDRPQRPRAFNPHVPRDLEAIVLKCLEKSRPDRYETAADLADDLSRWLRGEPVRAKLRSPVYMAGKFLQRNWLPATATVAALYALLLTGGVLLIRSARDEAENKARIAKTESERAGKLAASLTAEREEVKKKRDEAEAQRRKAEAATKKATQLAQASLVRDAFDYAEEGDRYAALAVLAGAAEQDSSDVSRLAEHRRRLVSGMAQLARLTRFWRAGNDVAEADLDPSGTRLVTTYRDGRVGVWDVASGTKLASIDHEDKVRTDTEDVKPRGWVAAGAGGWVATVHKSGAVRLWKVRDGETAAAVWSSDRSDPGGSVASGTGPPGLASPIPLVRFSPDGRWFAAGLNTGVQLLSLDGETARAARPFLRPDEGRVEVNDIAFSGDSRSVAIGGGMGLQVWDLAALLPTSSAGPVEDKGREPARPTQGGQDRATPKPASASTGPANAAPTAEAPVPPSFFAAPPGQVSFVAWTSECRILCAGDASTSYSYDTSAESQVTLWNTCGPAEAEATLPDPTDGSYVSAAAQGDGAALLLVGVSKSGSVQAGNGSGPIGVSLPQHDPALPPPEFNSDGRWAAFVHGTDVMLAPVLSGVPEYTIKHPSRVVACRLHPDDPETFTTVCEDGTVRVWLASNAALRNTPPEDLWGGTGIALDTDGKTAVVQAGDGTLRFYDALTGARRFNPLTVAPRSGGLPVVPDQGYWVAPDADVIITRGGDLIRPGGSPPDVRPLGLGPLAHAAFSADGRRFVALSDPTAPSETSEPPDADGPHALIQLFDAADGSPRSEPFPAGPAPVSDVTTPLEIYSLPEGLAETVAPSGLVIDANGSRVLAVWRTGTRTWDLADPARPTTAEADEAISTARFTPDGELLLIHESGKVELRRSAAEAPAVTVDFGGDYYSWYQAAVAPGGETIATATVDTVRVWTRDGELLNVLKLPELWKIEGGSPGYFGYSYYPAPSTTSLRFSPDGKILAFLFGKDVHLWDARGGQRLAFPLRHHAEVVDFRFTAHPDKFVTLTKGGSSRVWDLSAGGADDDALRRLAVCQAAQRLSQHAAPSRVKADDLLKGWAGLDGTAVAATGSDDARRFRALEDCESSSNWIAVLRLADRLAAAEPSSALVLRQAFARRQLGDYAGARRDYGRALAMGDAPTARFSLADCFREEADRALDAFRTAASAELSPLDFSETTTYADDIARAEQLYAECLKEADQFAAGDPDVARLRSDVVRSLSTLARLCLRTKDAATARRIVAQVREITGGPDGSSAQVLDVLRAEGGEWASLGQELVGSGAGSGSTDYPNLDSWPSEVPASAESMPTHAEPSPAPLQELARDPVDNTPDDPATTTAPTATAQATFAFGQSLEIWRIVLRNAAETRAAAGADPAADGASFAASLDALTAHLLQYGPVAFPAPGDIEGLPPMEPDQDPLAVVEALYAASLGELAGLPPADPAFVQVRGGAAAALSRLARTALERADTNSSADSARLFGKARGIAEEHTGTPEILAALRTEADEWAAVGQRLADYSTGDYRADAEAENEPADHTGEPADIVEGIGTIGGWLFDGETPSGVAPALAEASSATTAFEHALTLNRLVWHQSRLLWEQSPENYSEDRVADGQRLAESINALTSHLLKSAFAESPAGRDDRLKQIEDQYRDRFPTAAELPDGDPATARIRSGFAAGYSSLAREALRAEAEGASSHFFEMALEAVKSISADQDAHALRGEAVEWQSVGDDVIGASDDRSAAARATLAYERAVALRKAVFEHTRVRQAQDPAIDLLSDADSLVADLNRLSDHLSNRDLDVEAFNVDREASDVARSVYAPDGPRAADLALQLLRLAYSAKEANDLVAARDAGEEAAKVYDALFADPALLKTVVEAYYRDEAYYRGNAAENLYTLGGAYLGLGDVESARRVFEAAVRQREAVVRASGSTPESIQSLADTLQNIGARFADHKSTVREARAYFLRALKEQQQYLEDSPGDATFEEEVADSQEWLADLECRLGNVRAAVAYGEPSLETHRRLWSEVQYLPGDDESRLKALKSFGFALIWAAYVAVDAGRPDEAADYAAQLETIVRAEENEGRLDKWGAGGADLATFYSNISHIDRQVGDGRSALRTAGKYVELREAIAHLSGSDADRLALATAHVAAGDAGLLLGDAASKRHYDSALAILDDLRSKQTRINLTDDTINGLNGLSLLRIDLGDFAGASTSTSRLEGELANAREGREGLAEEVEIRSQALNLLPQAMTDDAVITTASPKVAQYLFRLRACTAARRGEYDLATAETQRAVASAGPADAARRLDEAIGYAELARVVARGRPMIVNSDGRPPVTTGYQTDVSAVEAAAKARFVALALDALEEALPAGLEDRGRLFEDGPLDAVRGDERYRRIIESLPEATPEPEQAVAESEIPPA